MKVAIGISVAFMVLVGCAGKSDIVPDIYIQPPPPDQGPLPDLPPPPPPPPNPCEFNDGQSCQGGAACPKGLQPIIQPEDDKCYCRPPCVPGTDPTLCGGLQCKRVCVPMTDAEGKPRPGVGVCLPDPGSPPGGPCQPAMCQQTLECIGSTEVSFCRPVCTRKEDCPEFKMVCGEIIGADSWVCVPGEHPGGPKVGEDCGPSDVYCDKNLLCDPESKKCLTACNSDAADTCTTGTCTPLTDPARAAVIGWGCK